MKHVFFKKVCTICVTVLMVSVMALGTTGCSKTEDSASSDGGGSGTKTIGLCIASASNEFQSRIKDGMENYIKDNGLQGEYEFTFQDAKFDTSTQLKQVENMIAQGVDAIIMIAVDSNGSMACVNAANEAGVPIIGCNTAVDDVTQLTAYVGSDSVESGRIEMEALAEKMGGKGKLVELHGTYGHEPQILRNQGIREVLANYPDIEVIAENTANWSRDEAVTVMENWLQSDFASDITAVVAHNDAMAVGAMVAAEDSGRDNIMIAGIDANKDMLGYLKEGRVAVTVFQNATGQGAMSVETAIKILDGSDFEHTTMIPYELVTTETADDYLKLYE